MVAPTGEDIGLFSHCRPHKTRRWIKSFKGGAVSHIQQTFSRPLFRNGGVQQHVPQVLSKYAMDVQDGCVKTSYFSSK